MGNIRRPGWGGHPTTPSQRFQPYHRLNSADDASSTGPSPSFSYKNKWKSYQEIRSNNQEAEFIARYSVCTPSSSYHDLKCGHRIQPYYTGASCDSNCQKIRPDYLFVCLDCTIKDVRIAMVLQGMRLSNNDDKDMSNSGPTREESIPKIADKEIRDAHKKCHRIGMIVNKFDDPTMQFFDQFLREKGFTGIAEDSAVPSKPDIFRHSTEAPVSRTTSTKPTPRRTKVSKIDKSNQVPSKDDSKVWQPRPPIKDNAPDLPVVATKVGKKYKLPRTKRIPAFQVQMKVLATAAESKEADDLAEILNETRIALKLEDDFTKAVREAMAECALDWRSCTLYVGWILGVLKNITAYVDTCVGHTFVIVQTTMGE
ncbi:hypothetical protein BDU57DRAFT_579243 [Ampelomyces quisqualis]|uniref:Uncharacterized protein n=1 Tax=Ampelomyces quisqualis TaxID=50730 RepID=A0A6A5QJ66_AMPQU|nr:hypothetical protein BDU57DRAFT_579243 [Ampelomyces quisqualis]